MAGSVLITGAAKRIGRDIALRLAARGWDIALHYYSSADEADDVVREISSLGRRAVCIRADLCDMDESVSLIREAADRLNGRLDVLIHNASIFERDSIGDVDVGLMGRHVDIHLKSPLLMVSEFYKQFIDSDNGIRKGGKRDDGYGNVIFMLDGMKGWSISPSFLSYAVSKEALAAAVPILARAVAPHIRVNAVALGATLAGVQDGEGVFEKIENITPLRATSNMDDIFRAIEFLLCTDSVTGDVIDISCGMNLHI